MEKATKTESVIRGVSLLRRIGSVVTVFIIFLLLSVSVYNGIRSKIRLSDLREIYEYGVSKIASVEEEYQISRINNNTKLTFRYSFEENSETYKGEYVLNKNLPSNGSPVNDIFTVHYLKHDPKLNSLNIQYEIGRIEKSTSGFFYLWLILKLIGALLFGLFLILQVYSFISEIKNIDQPIKTPDYLKKQS